MNGRSGSSFVYGVLLKNCILRDVSSKRQEPRTVLLGQVVRVENELKDNRLLVRLLKEGETWDSSTYGCNKTDIVLMHENLWQYIAAVNSPIDRVKLAKNKSKCEKLMQISEGSTIGFCDMDNVYLGQIRFIGNVKGMGKCVGIQLHEKKPNNRCNGYCAGIQYFNCLPGYGVFTTIERLIPYVDVNLYSKDDDSESEQNGCEKNVSQINITFDRDENKPHHEEIITTYNEYPKISTASTNKGMGTVRTSLSLQNIMASTSSNGTINTTNDFDQNTIIQPDSTYLIKETSRGTPHFAHSRHKSEVDLVATNASKGISTTHVDSTVKKKLDKNDHAEFRHSYNYLPKNSRNKSANIFSHMMDGTKTLPGKSKLFKEDKDNRREVTTKTKEDFYGEMNEKVDALAKASTSHTKTSYVEPEHGATGDFTLGSLVEVSNDVSDEPLYGVIRWMGMELQSKFVLVGIELEEELPHLPLTLTDGTHNGERLFRCSGNRALFVPLKQCHKDSRFQDGTPTPVQQVGEKAFIKECPIIQGSVAPLCMPTEEDVEAVCGKYRGIQGHHNSCYLDVTLFAMFTYTAVFDSLLFRPKGPNDIPYYEEVQRVLREEIVNPLRKNLFVRADRVMNLRKLLDQLSNVSGLTCEEKDPEEFLNSLLAQILKAKPFLKLSSGQEAYHYQLFVEKDDGLSLPTVQQLFEQSFLTSDIKLKEVPSCLIIQMPRFGKNYKMYPRILPSQLLDVTDVIENSPRQCTVCGKLAKWECKECYGECAQGLESTAFCAECVEKAHSHARRSNHSMRRITVPQDYSIMEDHCPPPRLYMELFAVICIETSHYVAFVKCGVGHEAPWCFFDSMADRKGEKDGYNIPEMVACPDVSKWLSDEQSCRLLHENNPLDRHLPEHARRLLCDAYICMYQSPDVMMYR